MVSQYGHVFPTHGAQKTGPHLALQGAPFMVRARDEVLWRSLVFGGHRIIHPVETSIPMTDPAGAGRLMLT